MLANAVPFSAPQWYISLLCIRPSADLTLPIPVPFHLELHFTWKQATRHASTATSSSTTTSAYTEALKLIETDKQERLRMLARVEKEIARVAKGIQRPRDYLNDIGLLEKD